MSKKILIVYESIHNRNTEKIANVIGETLDGDIFKVEEIHSSILLEYDIIGFGSGIYFGKHHRSLFGILEEVNKLEKKGFIFSTRSITPQSMAHNKLKRRLMEKGVNIIGEFSCKGENRAGPFKLIGGICRGKPDDKDLEMARTFAKNLKEGCK